LFDQLSPTSRKAFSKPLVLQAWIDKTTTGMLLANDVQPRHSLEYTVAKVRRIHQGEGGTDCNSYAIIAPKRDYIGVSEAAGL
jgi:hypothetical protein